MMKVNLPLLCCQPPLARVQGTGATGVSSLIDLVDNSYMPRGIFLQQHPVLCFCSAHFTIALSVIHSSLAGAEEWDRSLSSGSGRLKFNWSGKGSFCFTTNFVRRAFLDQETSRRYHYTRGVLFSRTGAVMVGR